MGKYGRLAAPVGRLFGRYLLVSMRISWMLADPLVFPAWARQAGPKWKGDFKRLALHGPATQVVGERAFFTSRFL